MKDLILKAIEILDDELSWNPHTIDIPKDKDFEFYKNFNNSSIFKKIRKDNYIIYNGMSGSSLIKDITNALTNNGIKSYVFRGTRTSRKDDDHNYIVILDSKVEESTIKTFTQFINENNGYSIEDLEDLVDKFIKDNIGFESAFGRTFENGFSIKIEATKEAIKGQQNGSMTKDFMTKEWERTGEMLIELLDKEGFKNFEVSTFTNTQVTLRNFEKSYK